MGSLSEPALSILCTTNDYEKYTNPWSDPSTAPKLEKYQYIEMVTKADPSDTNDL